MKVITTVLLIAIFALEDSLTREYSETATTIQETSNEETQSQCGSNETLHICGNQCDLTIWNYGIPFRTRGECREACVCRRGFVRNDFGICVMNTFPCYENEEFRRCETRCELSCDCAGKSVRYMFQGCQHGQHFKAGYRCKPGYVRHAETKKCVPNTECLPKTN